MKVYVIGINDTMVILIWIEENENFMDEYNHTITNKDYPGS